MPFLQLILPIGAADPAPYEDALLAAGASSITLEDEGDDPVLEPLPGSKHCSMATSIRTNCSFLSPRNLAKY